VVILLNLGLLALIGTQLLTPASHAPSDPLIGHPAPNFSLTVLHSSDGQKVLSLANFQGRPIVLNFWASWCDPCKAEASLLESSWQQMQTQNKDVVFLGIDFEETGRNSLHFLQLYNITYPTVEDVTGSAANKYKIISLPDTIFINRNGIVVSKAAQQLTAQILSNGLQAISSPLNSSMTRP
jgi:cytochrome c biogenesis protein CcmG/thiol:disulfide interchange protein DsbE